jgi:hypothetical protein
MKCLHVASIKHVPQYHLDGCSTCKSSSSRWREQTTGAYSLPSPHSRSEESSLARFCKVSRRLRQQSGVEQAPLQNWLATHSEQVGASKQQRGDPTTTTANARKHTHISSTRRRVPQTIWRLHSSSSTQSRPTTTARRRSTFLVGRIHTTPDGCAVEGRC